ncbi:armadillo-type protein [Lipomyces arxii]|uniref:armadillo-type protein n=1 Tax=Lipomyces arxii TaxID=56418 RepID=UPI0034CF6965
MADSQFVAQLTELLTQVTAPNSAVIKAASEKLQTEVYSHPQSVPAMIEITQRNPTDQIRQLAAVEVRKLVLQHWDILDESLKAQIRSSLLQSVHREPNAMVRHAISRVISEIAKIDLPNQVWSDLPAYLLKASTSATATDREIGIYILYSLLDVVNNLLTSKIPELLQLFSHTIKDPESQAVRTNTLLALGKVSEVLDSDSDVDSIQMFQQFIPEMVNVLKQLVEQGDEKPVNQVFEVFQTLLWVDSSIVSKSLGDLIQFMLGMAKEESVDSEFRILAIQFLISAVRYKKLKVQSLKLGPILTTTALAIAANNMDDMDDEEEDNTPTRLAFGLIDVLSTSLPPSQVMNILMTEVPKYFSSPEPNNRRAGLLGLSVAVEGAPEFLSTQLKIVLPIVFEGLRDQVLEVRVAALQALAQLADELQETISKEHELLLPAVFNMMDTTDLKIAKAACTALDAMIETMDQDVIEHYLQTLVTRLLQLLAQPASDISVKGPIIAAIGSAAHAAKNKFLPYFDATIRAFEPYLSLTEGEKELDVKGMAFDSLGAMAEAVGKDAFSPYANAVVQAAYGCLKTDHNRLRECAFLFFGVLSKIYGQEFAPFLPQIMPELFHCLEQEETGFDENADMEVGDADEEDPWQNITVNSAMAIEKEIAADVIGDLASGTREAFLPYLEEACRILIELASHFYEGIRKAALGSLWQTVGIVYELSNPPKWQPGSALKVPLTETVTAYATMVRTATLETLEDEDDRSCATVICDNFSEIIRLCGPGIIGDDAEPIATQMLAILKKQHSCQTLDDDPEDEDAEDAAEYDVFLIDSAMDVVVSMAAAYGGDFEHYFRTFAPVLLKFCSSSNDGERRSGVGALAEVVNGMKGSISAWTPQLLKAFVHRISDESVEVRGNATYGYGMLAEYSLAHDKIIESYPRTLQRLQQCLVSDSENHRAIANICGCVARMATSHMESVPMDEIVPALVYTLPLKDGLEENVPVFKLISVLYQQHNSTIEGLTTQVLKVLEYMFSNDGPDSKQFEDDENRKQVIDLVRYLHNANPSAMQGSSLLQLLN